MHSWIFIAGSIESRSSNVGLGERGLFITRDVEVDMLLVVCKSVAIARGIMLQKFAESAKVVISFLCLC